MKPSASRTRSAWTAVGRLTPSRSASLRHDSRRSPDCHAPRSIAARRPRAMRRYVSVMFAFCIAPQSYDLLIQIFAGRATVTYKKFIRRSGGVMHVVIVAFDGFTDIDL